MSRNLVGNAQGRILLAALSILALVWPLQIECATADQPYGVVIIVARVQGFDLTHVKQKTGKILLCIYNRTGLKQLTIRLDDQNGKRTFEEKLGVDKRDLRQFFDLPKGNYVLTEVSHPQWSARIDVN